MRLARNAPVIPKVTDPFANDAPWTAYEVFKAMAVGITLFPVRAVLLVLLIVFDFFVARCAVLGMALTGEGGCLRHEEPVVGWRRSLLWVIWVTNRIQLWCLGFWTLEIEDRRKDRSCRANLIVAAPHTALVDVFLVANAFPPCPGGVGKAELARLPFLSSKAIAAQTIFLDRRDKDSRATCKRTISKRAQRTWRGTPLVIFPEGTTTNGRVLIQFKFGAFLPGEAVQPITLSYPHRHYDPSWVGRNSGMVMVALRLMCQVYNRGKVTIFDMYVPCEAERADPALFAANVRMLMAESLGIPTTEHSYDDAHLSTKLARAHVSSDFEVERVRRLYGFDTRQMLALLRSFRELDRSKRGVVSRAELCRVLGKLGGRGWGARAPASVAALFGFLDAEGRGAVSYRGFLQTAALLRGGCSLRSEVQFAFLVYDLAGAGTVSVRLLKTALGRAAARGSSGEAAEDVLAGMEEQELCFEEFEELALRRPEVVLRALEAALDSVGHLILDGQLVGSAKKLQ